MENLKPKIEFYRQRDFSDKMNATFDFIRENFKPLFKYSFYIILPVCLLQTYAMNSFMSTYFAMLSQDINPMLNNMTGFFANYGILALCGIIGTALINGLFVAMMQTYQERENGLQGVTYADFKGYLWKNFWRIIALTFFLSIAILFVFGILVAISGLLAGVSGWTLVLTVPLIIFTFFCLIPFVLVMPVYLFEQDKGIFSALSKSWKLGTKTLWGLVGFGIVICLITVVIQSVLMLPYQGFNVATAIFSLSSSTAEFSQPVWYKVVSYLFIFIASLGAYISSIITVVSIAFHYFHACEKVEGVSIESSIENFNKF